jgi:hypothetical protein
VLSRLYEGADGLTIPVDMSAAYVVKLANSLAISTDHKADTYISGSASPQSTAVQPAAARHWQLRWSRGR